MTQMFDFPNQICFYERADLVLRTTKSALTGPTLKEVEMAIPTQARLRELFNYDPQTGLLIWKVRPRSEFKTEPAYRSFLSRRADRPAGHVSKDGYRVIVCDGTIRLAHRLIWLFVIGDWPSYPEFEIDHVNGDTADNRIQNLRKVTKSMNQRNGSMRVNNRSGVIGVNWVESKGAWIARIWDGPKHRYLGQFYDIEQARQARIRAERDLGYSLGHGKPRRGKVR